ncbi:beta-glucosidase [Asticcacaulis solisilvae]|uniref:beta-glucosidase n=1 Tax=Asticcacaulis solisilvae TaxID=1217274 RepID=UPI003FD7509E
MVTPSKLAIAAVLSAVVIGSASISMPVLARAAQDHSAWSNKSLGADARADLLLKAMTREEKLTLVFGYFGADMKDKYTRPPESRWSSAGYVPGIARLGIPAQYETDAGIGVATQHDADHWRERTSLPSGIATAATWDPDLAYKGGAMIGSEARDSGFNVMLAGGVNLLREPRNGRNFEYAGEDPWLAANMVAAQINGIQSNHVISTIKHYALNAQETGRHFVSSNIGENAAMTSDLLAFQIAIEKSKPGSVMCAYNRVNDDYACENKWLLNDVLKTDWGYKGYVMSDWGAVYSTAKAANAGLDQESAGHSFDSQPFFKEPLAAAIARGEVKTARLDDMVRRILRSLFATGLMDSPEVADKPIDLAAHAKVTQADAEAGMVLLKNDGNVLPLIRTAETVAIIGSHADVGVLSGGGSSQVHGVGGNAVPGLGDPGFPGPVYYHPSSPLKAIAKRIPDAKIVYDDGTDPVRAAKLAAGSDMVVVFANQWTGEDLDFSVTLPDNQDATISAVAAANPKTVVVLETGGPVLMPWADKTPAILEAWYPGTEGGEAIARVLFGEIDATGRLPATFPASLDQLPHPALSDNNGNPKALFDVTYDEGAAVGYKWFDKKGLKPLFPFGHGLSYTQFAYSGLKVANAKGKVTVSFDVKNVGGRAGSATPQVYVGPDGDFAGWEAPKRLAGFAKVALAPGAARHVSVTVDPRLLATYNKGWVIKGGKYAVSLGASSRDIKDTVSLTLAARTLPVTYKGN